MTDKQAWTKIKDLTFEVLCCYATGDLKEGNRRHRKLEPYQKQMEGNRE